MSKTHTSFFHKITILSLSMLFIFVILLPAIPSLQALWWEKLNVNIEVKTADFNYPRSKGYWAHCIREALEKGEGLEEIEEYLDNVSSLSRIFSFSGSTVDKLVDAYNTLMPHSRHSDMSQKLKAQLLALWLNYVSGYASGHTIPTSDGSSLTAYDIIIEAENVLINSEHDRMELMKDLCESYNTWWE